jgi:diguanylate cyclase (GGDEF)-like protein
VDLRATLRRLWQASLRHETRLAGALGGVLFAAGGLSMLLMLAIPGAAGANDQVALVAAVLAAAYGLSAALVIRWERLPFWPLHAASILSLPLVLVSAWATGGHDSPARFLVAFVVVWAGCFCRPPLIAFYVVLSSVAFSSPHVLEGAAEAFLRELTIVLPGLAAIAATVAIGRRALDDLLAAAATSAREHRALLRVATAVAARREPEELHALVAEEAARVLGADAGAILRYGDDDTAEVMGSWSESAPRFAAGTVLPLAPGSEAATVRASGRSLLVRHAEAMPSPRVAQLGYRSLAAAPIHVGDRLWGAVSVSAIAPGGLPPGADRRLADFGALVTTAIVNAEQRKRLAAQAYTDPLTGLANHRAFHERLRGEVERAQRHGRALSLVVIDVDAFKGVNDGAGHAAGDRVLAEVAGRLRRCARAGDLLARIGGDEFAWLLPETSAEDAHAAVERAREIVAAAAVAGGQRITISAGVCDLDDGRDADGLFRLADGALYWSKVNGRDAAHVYDPVTVRELSAAERADQLARSQALLGIRALARAIDAKDPSTSRHSDRVARLACALAEARGWSPDRVRLLHEAGLVHDVGKIGVPDAVLLKPGRLTPDEYEQIKRHAALGAQIVEDVLTAEQVRWIRGHHERPDGRGYPDGLTGEAIAEGAALLALADAYDVMTAARPYSTAKSPEVALTECRDLVGRQFAAEAVGALEVLGTAGLPAHEPAAAATAATA